MSAASFKKYILIYLIYSLAFSAFAFAQTSQQRNQGAKKQSLATTSRNFISLSWRVIGSPQMPQGGVETATVLYPQDGMRLLIGAEVYIKEGKNLLTTENAHFEWIVSPRLTDYGESFPDSSILVIPFTTGNQPLHVVVQVTGPAGGSFEKGITIAPRRPEVVITKYDPPSKTATAFDGVLNASHTVLKAEAYGFFPQPQNLRYYWVIDDKPIDFPAGAREHYFLTIEGPPTDTAKRKSVRVVAVDPVNRRNAAMAEATLNSLTPATTITE